MAESPNLTGAFLAALLLVGGLGSPFLVVAFCLPKRRLTLRLVMVAIAAFALVLGVLIRLLTFS